MGINRDLNKPTIPRQIIPPQASVSPYYISSYGKSLLSKALNFALSPKTIPEEQIISTIESSMETLPQVDANRVRFDLSKIH